MNSSEYERVREAIANLVEEGRADTYIVWTGSCHAPVYQVTSGEMADQILAIHGLRIEAGDQRLPVRKFFDDWGGESGLTAYESAQWDMAKAGFVKCIEKE